MSSSPINDPGLRRQSLITFLPLRSLRFKWLLYCIANHWFVPDCGIDTTPWLCPLAMIFSMNGSAESGATFSIFGKTTMADLSAGEIFGLMMIFTGGSYIAIFLGDMITKRGVGNGITVIIFAGILSNLFGNFISVYHSIASKFPQTESTYTLAVILTFLIYMLFYFLVLLVVTFINGSIRKIPIQQTGEGLTSDVKNLSYLPIKFNSAGVIPVIFASSIMTIPSTIAQFLKEGDAKWVIQDYFTLES